MSGKSNEILGQTQRIPGNNKNIPREIPVAIREQSGSHLGKFKEILGNPRKFNEIPGKFQGHVKDNSENKKHGSSRIIQVTRRKAMKEQ